MRLVRPTATVRCLGLLPIKPGELCKNMVCRALWKILALEEVEVPIINMYIPYDERHEENHFFVRIQVM